MKEARVQDRPGVHEQAERLFPVLLGEISSEQPDSGAWPLHLAIGPNIRWTEAVEILPEVSWILSTDGSSSELSFSWTVVADPTAWLGPRDGVR